MVGEWTTAKIEDVSEKVAMGPFGSSIKVETFVPHGIPVISGQHLHGSRLMDTDYNFVSLKHAEKLKNANVYRGDVVFTHAGNIGQVAFIPASSRYERYVISQRQFYLRPNLRKVLPEFIAYYFTSAEGQHKLLANTSSSGVPSIAQPVSYLRTIEIPLPPLSEQRAIAHILGTLDDKIELNRKMNRTLETMAQAIFKSWFVDFDPVRAKAAGRDHGLPKPLADLFPDSFEDSELGEIPLGWRVSRIRELTSKIQYGLTQSASTEPVGPRFLRITDIQGGCVNWSAVPYCEISPEGYERYRLKSGDVLVARTGASTGENIYLADVPDAVFASYLVRFQFSDLSIARMVGAFMRTNIYFDFVEGSIGGSAQPNASAQVLASAQLVVPPLEITQRFLEMVTSLDKRINAINNECQTLVILRNKLMPKLISGEIGLSPGDVMTQSKESDSMGCNHGKGMKR